MSNFISSPSVKKYGFRTATVAGISALALGACSSAAHPDATLKNLQAICFFDGATLRSAPKVPGTIRDEPTSVAVLDLDDNSSVDAGEGVCVPVENIPVKNDSANGPWYQVSGTQLAETIFSAEALTLPDGRKAPNIFTQRLGSFVAALGGEAGWVSSQRTQVIRKGTPLKS